MGKSIWWRELRDESKLSNHEHTLDFRKQNVEQYISVIISENNMYQKQNKINHQMFEQMRTSILFSGVKGFKRDVLVQLDIKNDTNVARFKFLVGWGGVGWGLGVF